MSKLEAVFCKVNMRHEYIKLSDNVVVVHNAYANKPYAFSDYGTWVVPYSDFNRLVEVINGKVQS